MPVIDYEDAPPEEIKTRYSHEADPYLERGSPAMIGAAHLARQMLWLEALWPDEFARARWYLGLPQYWAWRLSGVAAGEVTTLAAQSHLWNVLGRCEAGIVRRRGWRRLMAPMRHAARPLGPVRPALAARLGLGPGVAVFPGVHDSSANFYRHRLFAPEGFTLVSTGTWAVAMRAGVPPERLSEALGMTLNADIDGRPVGGALTMAGREFVCALDGVDPLLPVSTETLAALVAECTMMLPSWSAEDGLFPGSAKQGRIIGPVPEGPPSRRALVALYVALLALECASLLGDEGPIVLDGSHLADQVFAPLVAGLVPGRPVLRDPTAEGVVLGAALIAAPDLAVGWQAEPVTPLPAPGLADYRDHWRRMVRDRQV